MAWTIIESGMAAAAARARISLNTFIAPKAKILDLGGAGKFIVRVVSSREVTTVQHDFTKCLQRRGSR